MSVYAAIAEARRMIAGRAGSSSVSACCCQVASWSRLQRPPGTGASRRRLPSLEAADCHLQPVGGPTGGARNHLAGPEGGQDLRPGTLKPAEQPVSRLDASLDRQELFLQRAAGGWRDLKAGLPLRLATGLDGLVGGS